MSTILKDLEILHKALNELVELCHETSRSKGWWDVEMCGAVPIPHNIPEKLALIHSEVSEALEDYRVGKMDGYYEDVVTEYGPAKKPCGFPSELADIVIRVFDLCGHLNIDLGAAVLEKAEFNKLRSARHGGKVC